MSVISRHFKFAADPPSLSTPSQYNVPLRVFPWRPGHTQSLRYSLMHAAIQRTLANDERPSLLINLMSAVDSEASAVLLCEASMKARFETVHVKSTCPLFSETHTSHAHHGPRHGRIRVASERDDAQHFIRISCRIRHPCIPLSSSAHSSLAYIRNSSFRLVKDCDR